MELGNLMFNKNANQRFECPTYIIALLDYISEELKRIHYNIDQVEYNSPFENTAEHFILGNFEIHAYNWEGNIAQEYNFIYKVDKTKSNIDDIKISWYKYLGRDTTVNQDLNSDIYVDMFNDILEQLLKYEKDELKKKDINIYVGR